MAKMKGYALEFAPINFDVALQRVDWNQQILQDVPAPPVRDNWIGEGAIPPPEALVQHLGNVPINPEKEAVKRARERIALYTEVVEGEWAKPLPDLEKIRIYENAIRADKMGIGEPVPDEEIFAVEGMLKVKPPKKIIKEIDVETAKIGEILDYNTKGDFGIEVELEGANFPEGKIKQWTAKRDGSLRGVGFEYVLTNPLALQESKDAFSHLADKMKDSKLDFSFRTSVHVHVNILELTKKQLYSFLYLSHILEDVLVKYSGEGRTGNRFCLRSRDAEFKIELIKQFIVYKGGVKSFPVENVKYSAINLASIVQFGSVEFRSMRGTLDLAVLFPWLDVLFRIRDFAIHNTIKEISEAVRLDAVGVAQEVLGEHFPKFNYPELEQDIRSAYSRLIEIPYMKECK